MEKIDRYIYAVTKRIPAKQRGDIEEELRSLIEDMLGNYVGDRKTTGKDVEKVLTELGDPAVLADQYSTEKRYLVGPKLFDTYILVLKIVMAAVAFGVTLAIFIRYVVTPPQGLFELLQNYFETLISSLFQSFAWVTVIFSLIELFEFSVPGKVKDKPWSPDDLPPLPVKEANIKPIEAIVGIAFAVLAIIIFNTGGHLIGIYLTGEGTTTVIIPLFNLEVFHSALPLLNIMLAAGIIKESLKLVAGRWTIKLATANLVFNLASVILFSAFVTTRGIFNEAFFAYGIEKPAIPVVLNQLVTGTIVVMAFALFVDTVVGLIKGIKHAVPKQPK